MLWKAVVATAKTVSSERTNFTILKFRVRFLLGGFTLHVTDQKFEEGDEASKNIDLSFYRYG